MPLAILVALGVGAVFGLLNGYFVAVVGLSSLAVTLAGYVGFRGLARLLVQDRSVGGFPDWFTDLGQHGLVGPLTLSILIFVILAVDCRPAFLPVARGILGSARSGAARRGGV